MEYSISRIHPQQNFDAFVSTLIQALSRTPRDKRDAHAMTVGMSAAQFDGIWMEFGVYRGNTLSMMAKFAPSNLIYAFDSFMGLPERWRDVSDPKMEKFVKKNAFNMRGHPPTIPQQNVAFVVGYFNRTLPLVLQSTVPKSISFLHIDSDLYSSARYVMEQLIPRVANGTVIVFDELVNYPDYLRGELLALWEVFHPLNYSFELIGHACRFIRRAPTRDVWPQAVALRLRHGQ